MMNLVDQKHVEAQLSGRLTKNKVFKTIFFMCTLLGLIVLAILIIDILRKGLPVMSTDFFYKLFFIISKFSWGERGFNRNVMAHDDLNSDCTRFRSR